MTPTAQPRATALTMATLSTATTTLALALLAAPHAEAAGPTACAFAHPAIRSSCTAPAGVDANTFVVLPPASTRWLASAPSTADAPTALATREHRHAEHPAVQVAQRPQPGIDSNTFLVQPPVAVRWTVMEPPEMLAGQATPGAVR